MSARRSARRRRRRERFVKAVFAWIFCLALVALIAAGTLYGIRAFLSSKQNNFRQQGIEKLEAGDYTGAVADFDAALEKSGKRADSFQKDVLKYRAETEIRLEDFTAAAHTYDLLMERSPDDLSVRYMKVLCSAKLGDLDGALALYEETLAKEKAGSYAAGYEEALAVLGSACVDEKRYGEAMKLYETALNDGAENAQIYNQMGVCQMAGQDYEAALDSFDKGYQALASGYGLPEDISPSGLNTAVGQENSADSRVLRELLYNRAAVCEYLQNYKEAKERFEEYVNVFGEDENARHEIDFLKTR